MMEPKFHNYLNALNSTIQEMRYCPAKLSTTQEIDAQRTAGFELKNMVLNLLHFTASQLSRMVTAGFDPNEIPDLKRSIETTAQQVRATLCHTSTEPLDLTALQATDLINNLLSELDRSGSSTGFFPITPPLHSGPCGDSPHADLVP